MPAGTVLDGFGVRKTVGREADLMQYQTRARQD